MKLKIKFNNKKKNLSQPELTCQTQVMKPDNFRERKLKKNYKDQFSILKDIIKKRNSIKKRKVKSKTHVIRL